MNPIPSGEGAYAPLKYKGRTTIERQCEFCGCTFHVPPSRVKHGRGRHCSRECQYAAVSSSRAKSVNLICEGCGVEYVRPPSIAEKARFCTRECRDKHWVGDLTPNWQDGSGVYKRGPNWQSIRREALRRDNNECQHCGTSGDLHVHHKIPFRMFDSHVEANDLDNLISLCPPCHRKEDARSKWAREGDVVIRMSAGGYAWELARAMQKNGNFNYGEVA